MRERFALISDVQATLDHVSKYPFTHVTIDDDGWILFKRWIETNMSEIEVSYLPRHDQAIIYAGGSTLWQGELLTIPDDDDLLDMIRDNLTWIGDVSEMKLIEEND